MSDPLPADLAEALDRAGSRLPAGLRLHHFRETDSTNDVALDLAAAGAAEGTAVLADVQHAGRGRRGHTWFSPPGAGIYLSCVVRGEKLDAGRALLTLATGVATGEAIANVTGLPVELKWPNDIVIGRPWRKLAGILCESTGRIADMDAVVIGIGINLESAAYPPELGGRATSIETELGRPIDRAPLVVECLVSVLAGVARLRRDGEAWVLPAWRQRGRAGLRGAAVRWQDQGHERSGVALDLDSDGALLVESGGRIERLVAGEVTWERLT